MKYVMFETSVSAPLIVVFTEQAQHKVVAKALEGLNAGTEKHPVVIGKAVAAGLVDMGGILPRLHGSSVSLGIGTTPEAERAASILLR